MARIKGISANLNALLDTIAYAEGVITGKHPLTKDDGYDVIVTGIDGPEITNSYVDHPFANGRKSKVINSKGLTSNASGRYQQMYKDWPHYKILLGLPDFGSVSQDKLAIQHIKESRALPLIEAGKFQETIAAIRNLWASLPGAGYGQFEHSYNELLNYYLSKGGTLWESKPSLSVSLPQSPEYLEPSLQVEAKASPQPQQMQQLDNQQPIRLGLWSLIKNLLKPK